MGNVARVGDLISCGDHIAEGSKDVFAGGMPIATSGKKATTGHGCFPPTTLTGGFTTTVFVNGNPVALKNITKIVPHRCGKQVHDGVVVTGAGSVSAEES